MTPDYIVALEFLEWLYPQGPWLLTAIPFNRIAPFPTRKFSGPSQRKDVLIWLLANEAHNLYYNVNEPVESCVSKKSEKKEIARVHFLQIDMDVRKSGETEEDARARIEAALERYGKVPSALVNSGGGFNALFRLTTPVEIDQESESRRDRTIDEVERKNKQLAADLEGDVTHDVNRILRLPGTINRLNKTKVERGRVPSLSSLLYVSDRTYDFDSFISAPAVATNQTTSSTLTPSASVHTEDIEQLNIPPKLKMIITQGFDPDDASGPVDRSSNVWFVCCELIRLAVKDEVILGIITDSRYRISDHVYAQGSRWQQYAVRQIRRAKEKAIDPRLLEMNDRHAVIRNYGGKCMVMTEEPGLKLDFIRPNEFFLGRDNEHVVTVNPETGKPKVLGLATWWFGQRLRRQYDRVVFEPGVEVPGALNLWQGFAVEPRPGKAHERYLENMFENICAGHQDRYDYLIRWMARVVQHPNSQAMVAPVIQGERGTGKSVFGKGFARLFGIGTHAFVAKDAKEITGRFNEHLRAVVFLLAEEAFDIRDKGHESTLKELITSDTFATEGKGLAIQQTRNYVHPLLLSNEKRVVPAGDMERRYAVMRARDKTHSNEWFRKIDEDDQREGSLSHLLHHLLSLSLEGFNVTDFPITPELREQQSHNLSREDDWLWSKLESGVWLETMRVPWVGPVIKGTLYSDYLHVMTQLNVSRPMSLRQFGMWLKSALPCEADKQLSPDRNRDRPWAFQFRPLNECRAAFAKKRGQMEHVWTPIAEDEIHVSEEIPFS